MNRARMNRARMNRARLLHTRRLTPLLATLLATLLAACSTTASPDQRATGGPAPGTGTGPALSGTVTVLAAASLTESFDQIAEQFQRAHPGVHVQTSYGSSATLVQQVNNGAPADVIALAGTSAAEPLDAATMTATTVFASNALEIAVPPDNPGRVTSLADLARPDLKVVLCADTVPCGKAADATFEKATVIPHVVSREIDVKATLAKVKLGEADAAVVYHSDIVASGDSVRSVPIDPAVNTTLRYPIITLSDDPAARAFVEQVTSPSGLAVLRRYGLGPP